MKTWKVGTIATAILIVVAMAYVAAIADGTGAGSRPPVRTPLGSPPSPPPLPPAVTGAASAPTDDDERTIDAAHERGIRVWIESDLVKPWLTGEESFTSAVERIAALARRPGVIGIKVANELGYQDGLNSAEQMRRFLTDTAAAVRAAAPGRPLLVDLLVPELGCLPGDAGRAPRVCAASQRDQYPHLTIEQVDGYLAARTIDVLSISTHLQAPSTYESWGVDLDIAQQTAWEEVRRRGWGESVRLHARKAFAHPGVYAATDTAAALTTHVEIPRRNGAAAVDIWTWRQTHKNDVYRLADPGLKPNALWEGLSQQRAAGAVLFTHLSPRALEVDLTADLDMIATVFTDLFVTTTTG